ncbi:MAG: indole-3-glycerol phosphate synthase TrpC [Coriobacteriia bacterium]|nr:indole-3-glycerol phosphate synthase TrpC [Coriobacteriia bacterium]
MTGVDFLSDMIALRTRRIAADYGDLSPADRERLACCAPPPVEFAAALRDRLDVAVIAEVKKASPSAGPIAPECEASKQALHYQDGGAAAISVLTEPESFGGSFTDLSDVADAVDVPVLCKDFVIDPVQLFVARGHGADAVLLMVSVLGDQIAEYIDLASTLGLAALVEVVDEHELETALAASANLIGVNSRNLRTLEVDTYSAHTVIRAAADAGATVVAASGVRVRGDVERAALAGAHAVLVGETLMRAQFPEDILEDLTGVSRMSAAFADASGS